MKNKHKIFACFLVCIMILSLPIHITAGIKPVKINYEKKTIEIGQKTQLKLKNAKNKVFWETKDKKLLQLLLREWFVLSHAEER